MPLLNRKRLCLALGFTAAIALAACSGPTSEAAKSSAMAIKEPDGGTPKRLRLLTADQYLNTLAYVFGPDVSPETRFAPMTRTGGLLSVGTSLGGVTDAQMEQYQKTASAVATQVTNAGNRGTLVPCTPADAKAADPACAATFIAGVGRLLYRQPLTAARSKEFVDEAGEAAVRLKDFYAGLGVALEGMLLSPKVLLVTETSEPDPKNPGRERLDAYSYATRLSLFLWNAAPDDALLKAAESGELNTDQGRAKVVERMLTSPRLEAGMRAFFDDMFAFDDFNNLAKDNSIYPVFTGVTAADAREQTLRTVIDQLITKKKDYRDLFTTRETFISPSLAALYRLPASPGWTPYEFPADSPRVGLLTQVSFLSVHSHPGRSSATLRGKALREILLCQTVPRPPANVDFSAVENPPPNLKTARQRVGAHLSTPVCAGCHKITDPMGLALENFDGAGQYRDQDNGAPIDITGVLDGKEFSTVAQLGTVLHDHPQLPSCLVKRVFSYGTGSLTTAKDKDILAYLDARFAANGYRLPDLLRTIALSRAFSEVAPPPVKTAAAN